MKKTLLLTAAMAIASVALSQTNLYEDDLESYATGSYMAVSNPAWWSTWSNSPGTGEDCVVSDDQAFSGEKSILVSPDDGITDALLKLGNKVDGAYELGWKMFIESGYNGYYNVQHFEEPGNESAFEVYFYSDGTGQLTAGGVNYSFTFPHDEWFSVKHLINIENDLSTYMINDAEVSSWPFHYQAGSTDGTSELGAVDFNDNTGFEYYVDDIYFDSLDLTGVGQLISSKAGDGFSVCPIPARDHVIVSANDEIRNVQVIDFAGRVIFDESTKQNQFIFNTEGFQSGAYLLRISTPNQVSVKKLIIQ